MFDVVLASCVVLVSASLSAVFWVGAAVVVSAALLFPSSTDTHELCCFACCLLSGLHCGALWEGDLAALFQAKAARCQVVSVCRQALFSSMFLFFVFFF